MSTDGSTHREQTRIMLRPIGSSLPLGFYSFGIGMLLLGCTGIGWIPVSEQKNVGMMLIAFVFVLKSGPLPQRILIGVFYGLAFIPLTYWIDRTAYRTYLRRTAKQDGKQPQPVSRRESRARSARDGRGSS